MEMVKEIASQSSPILIPKLRGIDGCSFIMVLKYDKLTANPILTLTSSQTVSKYYFKVIIITLLTLHWLWCEVDLIKFWGLFSDESKA